MRLKRSKEQDKIIFELTNAFNFKYDGVISRIAFMHSLKKGDRFDVNEESKLLSDGKEFRDVTAIFGASQSGKNYYPLYKSLLDQAYQKITTDEDFAKLYKIHLDHGLKSINESINSLDIVRGEHIDYLAKQVESSLELMKKTDAPKVSSNLPPQSFYSYSEIVEFELGQDLLNNSVNIRLNDLNEFDSHHIAVAGMTGSGKTQLVKDIIYQISKCTDNKLRYIFFDYKGEGNPSQLDKFLHSTDGNFIDLLNDDFNFNPLEYISLGNVKEQGFQIQSFVDSVKAIESKIGVKQEHYLKEIIKDCFRENNGKHPDMKDVYDKLTEYYELNNISPDSLLSTIDKLSSGIFNRKEGDLSKIYNKSLYLNLPITLADTTRQLCVFLILKYILEEFSKADDTSPVNNSSIKPLRYVMVIDEAHVYLKNKNARKILEDLLRIIRSKGVVIIMLTQGVEDYRRGDFDFSSQVKIPICLNVKSKDVKSMVNYLGTPTSQLKLEKAIKSLENGKGVVNFKEPTLIEIRQFYKTIG